MTIKTGRPLAERMRPIKFEDFFGQDEVVGEGKLLRQSIEAGALPSLIFWGPPGSGKTTLAHIIAQTIKAEFISFSAVTAGVGDLRKVMERAAEGGRLGIKTILFIDEIHRWNKAQQDALLPHVEKGGITLIGATTENPSFEVRGALLSRCRVFVLKRLEKKQIEKILERALADEDLGLGKMKIKIDKNVLSAIADMSNGDARAALNVLEYATSFSAPLNKGGIGGINDGGRKITLGNIKEAFQKSHLFYDKDGEEHYNIISALHKSMRGGDADAAVYWLARMLEGGEDPLYIARRLVRFASEDVGLINNTALLLANAVFDSCHKLGMPECGVHLAQCVIYLAKSEKSITAYRAYQAAQKDVEEFGNLPVPLHIRNAPTKLMKDLKYGKGYKYTPLEDSSDQEYLPAELRGQKYLK